MIQDYEHDDFVLFFCRKKTKLHLNEAICRHMLTNDRDDQAMLPHLF